MVKLKLPSKTANCRPKCKLLCKSPAPNALSCSHTCLHYQLHMPYISIVIWGKINKILKTCLFSWSIAWQFCLVFVSLDWKRVYLFFVLFFFLIESVFSLPFLLKSSFINSKWTFGRIWSLYVTFLWCLLSVCLLVWLVGWFCISLDMGSMQFVNFFRIMKRLLITISVFQRYFYYCHRILLYPI